MCRGVCRAVSVFIAASLSGRASPPPSLVIVIQYSVAEQIFEYVVGDWVTSYKPQQVRHCIDPAPCVVQMDHWETQETLKSLPID